MKEALFSKDRVNTGRQREIDALKAFSIIMMIITHCIDDLYAGYAENALAVIINDYLAQSVGASGFMICMGIGIIYSRSYNPEDHAKRGVSLLITGQLLNLFRYGLPYITGYIISGNPVMKAGTFLVFSGDILQFAGLFFLCMALFRKLKLKSWHIFVIAIVLNLIGMALKLRISTGFYALDQLFGLFVFTNSESYFPLFHWLIYPAFGMLYGEQLMHVKDKKKFYSILIGPLAVIFAVYYYIGICVDQPVFTVFSEWRTFCCVNIFDAIMHLFCNTLMITLGFFLTFKLSEKGAAPIRFIAGNINRYYCIHTVVVYFLEVFLIEIAGIEVNALICYSLAFFVIAICTICVIIYGKYMAAGCHEFFGRNIYFWYGVVVGMSIVLCIWASLGTAEFPNLLNDYLDL